MMYKYMHTLVDDDENLMEDNQSAKSSKSPIKMCSNSDSSIVNWCL